MDAMSMLWEKRRRETFQMQLRYWNLIGRNSGLMFFLYAMILIGGFYYKKWLDTLPSHFPGVLLISVLVALAGAHAPVRTFTARADLVFLLPAEAELDRYFRKSRRYSFLMQSAFLLILWILCAPLYFHTTGYGNQSFLMGAAALLLAKGWNIDCSWQELFIRDTQVLRFLRTGLTFFWIYFVLSHQAWFVSVVCAAVMGCVSYLLFHRQADFGLLNWRKLLESDQRQAMQFLRFANLFTDVPRLRRRMHARRLISRFFPVRRFERRTVFEQIFIKTFLRSDEYLGMYMRLTVIGILLGIFLNIGLFSVFLVLSIVYLTGLQLVPLWQHPFPQALAGLYPLTHQEKSRPFVQLTALLLSGQSVIVSAATGFGTRSFADFLVFLGAGVGVSLLFSFMYLGKRVQLEN
ncbi:ABC transporter permease [Sporolactobacillus terrae]|uniref:ABC transporter permease n=1 Tax=Sporolactobacillus terrae TaxID=269673 RepID=UPI00111B8A5C|nr:ABC transporter permease [Sporolactobacillus terrae]